MLQIRKKEGYIRIRKKQKYMQIHILKKHPLTVSLKSVFPWILTGMFLLLVLMVHPKGYLYGSTIDWYCQHVTLAETIRGICLETKTLAPAWLPLGGGSNGYQFAYYGYFRPDILIGCLLPNVSMTVIVTGYTLAGYLLAVLLLYRWLLTEKIQPFFAFMGSGLFLAAGCFFQTHRQIMFINYMPFLILALLMIRKKKYAWVCICLFLICLHSFYYAIACLAVAAWYWYHLEGKKFIKYYFLTVFCSVGMAMMLLLPSFLAILEHQHSGERATAISDLFLPELDFGNLLYGPYGMGLSMLCLYLLLLGLGVRKYRRSSVLFLFLVLFGIGSWVLNGTLYARAKILIPFVSIVIWHCIRIFQELHRRKLKMKLWPLAVIGVVLFINRSSDQWWWMIADAAIVGFFVCIHRFGKTFFKAISTDIKKLSDRRGRYCAENRCGWYVILLIMPLAVYIHTASSESWVELPQQSVFSEQELKTLCDDPLYRTETVIDSVNNCNALAFPGQQKMTMYSSVTNAAYNHVYYDLLCTPIQINNRTALLAQENPFLLQHMGVRYLITTEDKIPAGYHVIAQKEEAILAENPSVLPVAYTTSACMGQQQFEQLDGVDKLEALSRYTIVAEAGTVAWQPQREEISLKTKDKISKIVLVQFQVNSRTGKAVSISINGVKNKLAADSAPYPNQNHLFSFPLSAKDGIDQFTIQSSKGNYEISKIRAYAFEPDLFLEKKVTPVRLQEQKKGTDSVSVQRKNDRHTILSCQADAGDGAYFVTSIPMQKGMHLFVDGNETKIEMVDQAFAGTKLGAGAHEIELTFYPPGQRAGYVISILSGILFGSFVIYKKIPKEER